MTSRLISEWSLDGFVSEQRYYCSESSIDPLNLPVPKAVLAGDVRTYIDSVGIEKGKQYYLAVGSVKNGIEKLSEQVIMLAGILWTPASITKKLWVSSDSITINASKQISQLIDKSGNGYHFTQSNNVYKPVLIENAINNKPIIRFNGNNNVLYSNDASRSIFRNIDKWWAFFVIKNNAIGKESIILQAAVNENSGWRAGMCTLTNNNIRVNGRVNDVTWWSIGAPSDLTYQIYYAEVDFSTGIARTYRNGSLVSTSNVTTGSIPNTVARNVLSIGGNESNGTAYALSGDIVDIMVGTASNLDDGTRQKLEGWAAHKYGLTANLPIDHPYKNLVPVL